MNPAAEAASQSAPATRENPLLALVGSANSGKTTLFNLLTGSHYNTVNYPGATVEFALGKSRLESLPGRVMDTPGLSSLVAASPDEQVTVDALFQGANRPDLLLCVVDANQLARHLYLVRQLQEAGFPLVVAVTMQDLLRQRGLRLRPERLSQLLDCPVVALDPRRKDGLKELDGVLAREWSRRKEIRPGPEDHRRLVGAFQEERIREVFRALDDVERLALEPEKGGPAVAAPQARGADALLLHPLLGLALFLSLMTAIFTSIFWLAVPFMDGIDTFFGWALDATKNALPASWVTDFLAEGIIGGIGAVSVFLPQIVILFVAMGYLEDSGYLARGAALVDKPLSKIGLNGKSFVPLLSGYACAIPAMLAARTIGNRGERFLTLLIIPLMSCSARLPVYALLLAFLLPRDKPWLGGLAMTGLYVSGMVLGSVVATVASRFLKKGDGSHFMLELPALRFPLAKVVLVSTYHKTMAYVRKAGPTIIAIAAGLWVITHTPAPREAADGDGYVTLSQSYAAKVGKVLEPVTEPMGLDWRGGVALICGFAAREVFVGSLALAYRVQEEGEEGLTGNLLAAMPELRFEGTGQRVFTVASSLGLLVFYLIALQCFPTVATMRNESGSWKLALTQLAVFTGGAYALAVATVQGLRALGVE